jgi:hypothetical protein
MAAASDKVYQLLAHGRWFSPGTPASSTTKIGRHDIAEILLKVALKHQKSINQPTVKTTRYGLNSFRYYASKTWNELSDHFRKETYFNHFKSLINSWNGS